MRFPIITGGALAVVLALAGPLAGAQESGLDAAFKIRAGMGLASSDDHLQPRTMGLGFELGYAGTWGRFGAEAGYQYKPGNLYSTDPAAMPVAKGATVDPATYVDTRKNQVGGLALRLSFERAVTEAWAWRAGLQVGGAKYRQEYVGEVMDAAMSYTDTYNGIVTRNTVAVSPYLGVRYTLDAEQALELNLVDTTYTSGNYVHVAGSMKGSMSGNTALDYIATRKHAIPTLEFGYVLRF